ncbi:hypothetical protein N8314_03530 [Akkermansiaceae bacterium]|nr:hypothetical protein [Akkermansiaceae bacterium]
MNILFPRIQWRLLAGMLGIAALGALVAGSYGIIHDQITYSISEEYFTKLKFDQFYYADFGLGRRVFVAEIGFLATWWVGFIVAWFLARMAVPVWPFKLALHRSILGCVIVFVCSLCAAGIGYGLGVFHNDDYSNWSVYEDLGISDIPAFVRVAYIHNAGYLGALIGLIVSVMRMRNQKRTEQVAASDR